MSEKIYAWLLKLYPVHFREDFGTSAVQLFRDRLRAERGVFQRFRFWLDVLTDLAISIPREHRRHPPTEPDVGAYRVSEEAVTAMTKSSAVAPAVFVGISVLLGLTAGWFGDAEHVLLFAAYFPLAIRSMGRFCSIGRFKEYWQSYQLILETDRLEQKQHGNCITVRRGEVVKINEDQHGLLVICRSGNRSGAMSGWGPRHRPATIWIPAGLTGYRQVRQEVSRWIQSDRLSQRRSLWLSDPRPLRSCIWSLLPAMLLIRSVHWFLVVAAVYYGLVLFEITITVVRPPRNSGLIPRPRGLDLPPAAYMWRRFKRHCRQPPLLALIVLPILRAVVATPY